MAIRAYALGNWEGRTWGDVGMSHSFTAQISRRVLYGRWSSRNVVA